MKKAKNAHAEKLTQEYIYRLQNDLNPFDTGLRKAVYEDNLRYAATIRLFKERRSSNFTLNYYSNQFLPEMKGMADKTYRNYVSKFPTFDAWLSRNNMANNDFTYITPAIMQRFSLYLINDEELARITLKKYQHMLERLFDYVCEKKYFRVSPMQDLPDNTHENDQAPRPINEAHIVEAKYLLNKRLPPFNKSFVPILNT